MSTNNVPLYFQTTTTDGNYRTGGYIFTSFTPEIPSSNVFISASATLQTELRNNSEMFLTTEGVVPNSFVWVSNPLRNTLNKITLVPGNRSTCNTIKQYEEKKLLCDGFISTIETPYRETNSTFNYKLSGISGIYGMAIDPRNYELIACDSELDQIYKFSADGTLLSAINLYEVLNNFEFSNLFSSQTKETSSFTFNILNPKGYELTSRSRNYLVTVGGALQEPENYTIDIANSTITFTNLVTSGLPVNVRQLYNPEISDIFDITNYHWTLTSTTTAITFILDGTVPLVNDSKKYCVHVSGVLQSPDSYTISSTNRTITFDNPIPVRSPVVIIPLPVINEIALKGAFDDNAYPEFSYKAPFSSWSLRTSYPTTTIKLTGTTSLANAPLANAPDSYLVNVGGVLQHMYSYLVDSYKRQITFNQTIEPGTLITVTQVDSLHYGYDSYVPSSVSIDKDYNFWVSFFNGMETAKFDKDFNLLFTVTPSLLNTDEIIDGDNIVKPPSVETDRNNNCWVTYAYPLCSLLVKYSPTGEELLQIPLEQFAVPTSIAINRQNNVWVANTYNITLDKGSINLYNNTTGTVITSLTGFSHPSYITVDRNNKLWFTFDQNKIGYYDPMTETLQAWGLQLINPIDSRNTFKRLQDKTYVDLELIKWKEVTCDGSWSSKQTGDVIFVDINLPEYNTDVRDYIDEDFGGLAVDVYNRLWILNSLNNLAWVIPAMAPLTQLVPNVGQTSVKPKIFKIQPNAAIGYYNDTPNYNTYTQSFQGFYYRSAQATSDWTGYKWYQKYLRAESLSAINVVGSSRRFDVLNINDDFNIRYKDDSFNMAGHLQSLMLPEHLQNNPGLFNEYFGAICGTGQLSANLDPGSRIYDKIANFTTNHADIETCGIQQLKSLAKMVDVTFNDYNLDFPSEISKFLDIFSIPRAKLWGVPDLTPQLPSSIGKPLNPITTNLIAGESVIVKNKSTNERIIYQLPRYNNQIIYSLSSFNPEGFSSPFTDNYILYEFTPVYSGKYIENIIDWETQNTNLTPNLSTYELFYGDNGVVERTFNYLLIKNLISK